jgi:thiamine transport system substrate-binding protein
MTHDSWAISDELLATFEAQHNVDVQILTSGDGGALVNRAILAKGNPIGDVLYGVDNTFLSRALTADLFVAYRPAGLESIPASFRLDPADGAIPIDFGDVCLNYDVAALAGRDLPPPTSLEDLIHPDYRGLLVVQSPLISSPGLAFLLTTIAHFGESGYLDFWRSLEANDVLVVGGWESAYYGEFSGASATGTRPLVVSYSSSPPVEVVFAETPIDRPSTAAVVAADTCFRQIEFAGILAGTKQQRLAETWMDFLLSREFQEDLPLNMFVFPVLPAAELPEAFERFLVEPDEPATVDPARIASERGRWIRQWREVMAR